jgi:hypothetical protein
MKVAVLSRLMHFRLDADEDYGQGIHGRTRNSCYSMSFFLCYSVDSVAIQKYWPPV